METVVSETFIDIPLEKKNTCRICFDDDFETEQMFSVALCGHRFCVECVKRYVEVGLLEGSVLRCPHYQCESMLSLRSCANLLTPKLRKMWEQRIEEESIPITERVYCPDPKCSALMLKTELLKSNRVWSYCVKCRKPFCINCKVLWHFHLSCNDYKRLGPNHTTDDIKLNTLANQKKWRRCGKCQHMIERSEGCIKVSCRCGYSLCYTCGAEWKEGGCAHRQKMREEIWRQFWICMRWTLFVLSIVIVITLICVFVIIFGRKKK